MLVRRRGPRRIPGPRRPHPCGKDIMIFSLSDFFGYSMAVTSACDYLKLSPEDFHNWEVRLGHKESRRNKSGLFNLVLASTAKFCTITGFCCRKEITPSGGKFGDHVPR